MLSFLVRHSLPLMFVAALLGFAFPTLSLAAFPFLPYVLFSLMLLTLLGIKQSHLLNTLKQGRIWLYAVFHAFVLMLLSYVLAQAIQADEALTVAMVAIAATGSLFATPAIVRALGFDVMSAMAMTIASTLFMPVAVYCLLNVLQSESISLDMQSYLIRLLVFVVGPMLLSFFIHLLVPQVLLSKALAKISPYTILLVFAFPFGLIGAFRSLWGENPLEAGRYLFISCLLIVLFFSVAYFLYKRQGSESALMAAITAANRNILLTYALAGPLLGPAFLPLAGALQVPTYVLPVFTKWLAKRLKSNTQEHEG